jgi:DNA-binding MarR family transcriptional regulator
MAGTSSPPRPGIGQRELADLASTLERALSWIRRALRPTEWSAVALSTLAAVDRLGPLRITDLVARERITQPGMTGLVARLEAAGLVQRRQDPTDGRATLVEVTPVGTAYLVSLHRQRAATLAEHLRRLDLEEQRLLVAAVGALHSLTDQPLDEGA